MADTEYTSGTLNDQKTTHHLSVWPRRGRPPVKIQLNLTSMIDVIFQLLIYFVLTANFNPHEGILTAKLPRGSGVPNPSLKLPVKPLNIELSPAGQTACRIIVQSRSVGGTFTELADVLVSLQHAPQRGRHGAYKPDDPIIIKPRGQVRWQHVVNAFNAAIKAQYSNVNFASAEEK